MEFFDGTQYTKDCRDFRYVGIECCEICHNMPDNELDVVMIDGEPALICCSLRKFFYPNESHVLSSRLSPEEKLLRAIFNEHLPHKGD